MSNVKHLKSTKHKCIWWKTVFVQVPSYWCISCLCNLMPSASGMSYHSVKKNKKQKLFCCYLTFPWESENRRSAHLQRHHGILLASDCRELTWTTRLCASLLHAGAAAVMLCAYCNGQQTGIASPAVHLPFDLSAIWFNIAFGACWL